jgi:hypothetical protein
MPEVTRLLRDGRGRFAVILAYGPGNVTIPVTDAQAQTLIEAATQRGQVVRRWPFFLNRHSTYFQAGNELTAVMNKGGDPDSLLALVPFEPEYWLGWVAGDGAKFWFVPKNVAHNILASAKEQAIRYDQHLFEQPNRLVNCLRAAITCRILETGTTITYYDNYTSLPLDERVFRAAAFYERKRGRRPTTLIFHSASGVENQELFGMRVLSSPNVLRPPHIEIGLELD